MKKSGVKVKKMREDINSSDSSACMSRSEMVCFRISKSSKISAKRRKKSKSKSILNGKLDDSILVIGNSQ